MLKHLRTLLNTERERERERLVFSLISFLDLFMRLYFIFVFYNKYFSLKTVTLWIEFIFSDLISI